MKCAEALARLRQHEADLKRLGVEHLFLFGSTARDEASDASDVDLFFDHARGRLGLFEIMEVEAKAAAILGRKADVMTRASLHPALKQRIESSAMQVF